MNLRKFSLVLMLCILCLTSGIIAAAALPTLGINTSLTNSMLDNSTPFTNEFNILNNKSTLIYPKVYVGVYAKVDLIMLMLIKHTTFIPIILPINQEIISL
jgi:hypothetical protein